VVVGEGHAPVVAVLFLWVRKGQTSPLLPPKGADRGPPRSFYLQISRFQGPPEGTMIAILDPWQSTLLVGEGHAPFRQYFSRL
jgi:hypothetical protein